MQQFKRNSLGTDISVASNGFWFICPCHPSPLSVDKKFPYIYLTALFVPDEGHSNNISFQNIYYIYFYTKYISVQNIYQTTLFVPDEGHSYNKHILHIYFYTKYISLVSMYTYLYTKYTSVHTYLYTKYIYLTALLVPDEGHFPHLPDI